MARLERDGVTIDYRVRGSGPVVLLTHGYAASSAMFDAVADDLAADHTLVVWDQRGHGASDYPDDAEAYSPALAVADIAALLDAVGADRAVIGGHSLGGFLSLEFHLAHPERVAGLALVDTGPGFRSDQAREGWNAYAERIASVYERDGLAALAGSEELDAGAHRDAAGLVMVGRHVLPQYDSRVIDSLPSIDVPTTVVVGADDEAFLAGSRYMADKIPGAELCVIDDAGHAPCISQPAAFVDAVRRLLRRVADERPASAVSS